MKHESFLIDTSAWILALRRNPLEPVKNRIAYLLESDAVVTTEIIKLELLGGTKTEKEFTRLKTRLDALESASIAKTQWEKAFDLAFTLRRSGLTVPYTDIFIASCALTADLAILHADAHFDIMAEHMPLRTESYVKTVP
jgi:predicted nucleic acid-binding protein